MSAQRPTICVLVGTRPEAIKMAPVVRELRRRRALRTVLVASGQHPDIVEQTLVPFGLAPDLSLTIRRETGAQVELLSTLAPALDSVLDEVSPAAVVVHGDTTTALVGALTAFWRGHAVIHVEAGLRSGDLRAPFPEEANRRLIDQLSTLHLAPTASAAANLLREGANAARVVVTGNTVVSALTWIVRQRLPYDDHRLEALEAAGQRLVLVTIHRRESWGAPMRGVLLAIRRLVATLPDCVVVLPAHPNPVVRGEVMRGLADVPRTVVCDPLPYPIFAQLLARAALVLTDSGGVQEEAPTFGVPVLVLRGVTERPEAIAAGCATLVGTDSEAIVTAACSLLAQSPPKQQFGAQINPFGDEHAAYRCAQAIVWQLGLGPRPADFASGSAVPGQLETLRPRDFEPMSPTAQTPLGADQRRRLSRVTMQDA